MSAAVPPLGPSILIALEPPADIPADGNRIRTAYHALGAIFSRRSRCRHVRAPLYASITPAGDTAPPPSAIGPGAVVHRSRR